MEELYKQLMNIKNINDGLIRSNDWQYKRQAFEVLVKEIKLFEYDFISYYINHVCERRTFNKRKLRSIRYFSNTFLSVINTNLFEQNLLDYLTEFVEKFFDKR